MNYNLLLMIKDVKKEIHIAKISNNEKYLLISGTINSSTNFSWLINLRNIRASQEWLCLWGDCEMGKGEAIGIKEHNAGVEYTGNFYQGKPSK